METTENTNTLICNNMVSIKGEIASEGVFNHDIFGEKFYAYELLVCRESNTADLIPLIVSERLCDISKLVPGTPISLTGQFRSYNKHNSDNKNKLILSVFARELSFEDNVNVEHNNSICLNGYICKQPVYRKTPLGREIADILLAVNRPYGKSDYIPCIAWGRNARFAESLQVGDNIVVNGRIQSRNYNKKINENETEQRVAYEVSVSKISLE